MFATHLLGEPTLPAMESNHGARRATGLAAESAVCELIVSWGWSILGRNLHLGHYEIDIVARDGATLVIIEVRFRGLGSFTSGFGSLSARKRRFVRFAGERLWQARYRHDQSFERVRFDAASVCIDEHGASTIEYSLAAF